MFHPYILVILYIKYMVGHRCTLMVREALSKLGPHDVSVDLGMVEIRQDVRDDGAIFHHAVGVNCRSTVTAGTNLVALVKLIIRSHFNNKTTGYTGSISCQRLPKLTDVGCL